MMKNESIKTTCARDKRIRRQGREERERETPQPVEVKWSHKTVSLL